MELERICFLSGIISSAPLARREGTEDDRHGDQTIDIGVDNENINNDSEGMNCTCRSVNRVTDIGNVPLPLGTSQISSEVKQNSRISLNPVAVVLKTLIAVRKQSSEKVDRRRARHETTVS
ncbi:unnamed protein product [Nippostrongylus brasiliensis]|uniref:Uncharacterized protein n=1 Tax=Nippostrongylus brasiliensis TaxID=27835 RepID=A0A0N4YBR9_NIPBR|nr:unnamed protein product [Nippostrongylus brasiliensis]